MLLEGTNLCNSSPEMLWSKQQPSKILKKASDHNVKAIIMHTAYF